jgi:hypothetical protein
VLDECLSPETNAPTFEQDEDPISAHMEYCYEQLRNFEMVDSDGEDDVALPEMECLPKDLVHAIGSAKKHWTKLSLRKR